MRAILPIELTAGERGALSLLLGLMALSALTEGLGLLLLVPMLALLANEVGQASGEPLTRWLLDIGFPLQLPALLAIFVALVALRAAINYARSVQAFRFEMAVVDRLREEAWDAILHADWRYLSQLRQSDQTSMLISNISRIGYGLSEWMTALATGATLLALGLAALAISPPLALAAALVGLLVHRAYRRVRGRSAELGEELTGAHERVHANLSEGLSGLRVVKSFGRENEVLASGADAFARLRAVQLAYVREASRAQLLLQVAGATLLALLVWLAIAWWGASEAQVLPLVVLFARALPLLATLQSALQGYAHAEPAFAATRQLTAAALSSREPAGTAPSASAPRLDRAIALQDVSVRFSGRNRAALESVTVEIPAGSFTLLEGPSGAGKSTLADVLAGLISPDAGTVRIDDTPLEGEARRAWRSRVTYVQQEPVLFTGTVRDNLLWADPEAEPARLEKALSDAAAGFLRELPQGLETPIGDAGKQLSGGERQRLVLARALLRDPALLILDEATSALDAENQRQIAAALDRLRGRITILVIGHGGALGELADRRISLAHGRIVG